MNAEQEIRAYIGGLIIEGFMMKHRIAELEKQLAEAREENAELKELAGARDDIDRFRKAAE